MRTYINYCKNCGAEYQWQASGSYNARKIEAKITKKVRIDIKTNNIITDIV